jgi:hypothetical protein
MKKVYILQAEGFGDSESEFYNIAVFSTLAKLNAQLVVLQAEWAADDMQVVTNIEEMEV